jgi:hypothetical protein
MLMLLSQPGSFRAGEPIRVGGPVCGPEGALIVFTTLPISYRTDGGPMSALIDNATGTALVDTL